MRKGRMLAGLVVVAAGASAITAGLLAGVGGAGQPQAGSEALSRVERTFGRWGSHCGSDFCVIGGTEVPVTMPADHARVDVTMSVTLAYSTSRSDGGMAHAGVDAGTPQRMQLNPRRGFPLAPARRGASTTLTWQKRGLAAGGREYKFNFSVVPRGFTKDGSSFVRGSKLSVVIETWSVGD